MSFNILLESINDEIVNVSYARGIKKLSSISLNVNNIEINEDALDMLKEGRVIVSTEMKDEILQKYPELLL